MPWQASGLVLLLERIRGPRAGRWVLAAALRGTAVEACRRGLRSFAGVHQADVRALQKLPAWALAIALNALVVQCVVNEVPALRASSAAAVKRFNLLRDRLVQVKGVTYAGARIAVFYVVGS